MDLSEALRNSDRLKEMRVDSILEADILRALAGRERMVSELTEEIYGVTRQNSSYHAYYMKVSRSVKSLQRSGYVATRLIGRDRPYKLTPFAANKILKLTTEDDRLFPLTDVLVFSATLIAGGINIALVYVVQEPWLSSALTIIPYTLFLVLSGFCLARLGNLIRKVS